MKNIILLALCWIAFGCDQAIVVPSETYSCQLSFPDASAQHPLSTKFQLALDQLIRDIPGVQVALRTPDGHTWTGAAGMADIPNGIPLETCHRMMVGSISKVFTAATLFRLQEEGLLSIDDPLRDWIDAEIIDEIANAKETRLLELLNHTSGIADYNDAAFTLDGLNAPGRLLKIDLCIWFTSYQRGRCGLQLFQYQLCTLGDGYRAGDWSAITRGRRSVYF